MSVADTPGTAPNAGESLQSGTQATSSGQPGQPGQPSSANGSEPAKIIRIGSMIRALLEEVRHAPLDVAGRDLMKTIYNQSVNELYDALPANLAEELDRLTMPLDDDTPSEPELRMAQAQLVGWLEGLFHGIQAAVSAQQVMAERQLRDMRSIPAQVTRNAPTSAGPGNNAYL